MCSSVKFGFLLIDRSIASNHMENDPLWVFQWATEMIGKTDVIEQLWQKKENKRKQIIKQDWLTYLDPFETDRENKFIENEKVLSFWLRESGWRTIELNS